MKQAPLRGCGAFLEKAPAEYRASVAEPSTWRISRDGQTSHDQSPLIRRVARAGSYFISLAREIRLEEA
jgi:uncharacterized protein (DUF2461 family)